MLALVTTASAQPAGDVPLDTFRPAMDSRGYLTVNASQVLGHKELSFGIGSLDWGYKMLNLSDGTNTYDVNNMVTATLIAAFGLKAGPAELEFGASVPFVIMSGDRNPNSLGDPATPNDDQDFKLDGQGIGNLGIHFKTRFLKTSKGPRIGLGVIASLYLPTTSPNERWLGDKKLVPQVMGILDKEFGYRGRFRIAANAGIRIRPDTTFTNNDATDGKTTVPAPVPVTNQKVTAGTEVPFGLGVAYAIAVQKFDVVGEIIGALPVAGNENYQPLEAIGGIKLYLARNSFLSLGGGVGLLRKAETGANPDVRAFIGIVFEPNIGDRDGDGIKDDVDKCPDDPEDFDQFEDTDGCPDPDNDQDGILDVDDLCPNDPEDKDGFEDEDGCPDLDNDKDRILDQDDKCPNEPETYNGFEDEDGCPDRGRVVVTDTSIEILDMVYFEYNKAIIKKESYPILDAVAATLQGNPSILLIEVQGHTDERGNDDYNLDLSDRRAKAVKDYLIDKGVEANRLESQGYGETQPLIREHNEKAWAKNRRVAFLILKRATD
jgi:outer membrane protein OmpA-like peptidoglycan-associated protein